MQTLLLTATIKPFVSVAYNDPEIRSAEYRKTLERYICDTDFDRIIFAENSGYEFDIGEIDKLAAQRNKELIYLNLSESERGSTMSTGEAYLMRSAIEKCLFLRDDDVIWKSTGRVFIRNANKVLHASTTSRKINMFLYAPKYDSLQTWFFCVKVCDLKKYFLSEEVIGWMEDGCIEYAWMDCWRKYMEEIEISPFPVYPDAEGINSIGKPYTLSFAKLLLKNALLRVGYFTIKKSTKKRNREGL